MISQIYIPKNSLIYEDPDNLNFGSILLGESEKWEKIYDPNDTFSLGGSKENPLSYTFTETGFTEFTLNLVGVRWKNPDPDKRYDWVWYELFIQGDKKYYVYSDDSREKIINRTIPVYGIKGQKTYFRLNILYVNNIDYIVTKIFLRGDPDTVYSSITAQYIPDSSQSKLEKSQPIIIKNDSTLKKNRRYLVYAPYAKILQLNLDEEEEFEVGDWIEIKNMEFGNFQLNSMKYDIVMRGKSTRTKNGYIKSVLRGDFVRLECLEKSPERVILSDTNTVGNFTIL